MKIVTQHRLQTMPGPYQTHVAVPPEMRRLPLAFLRTNNWPTFPEGMEYAVANCEVASVQPSVWLSRENTTCFPYGDPVGGAGVLANAFAVAKRRIIETLAKHVNPAIMYPEAMKQAQARPLPGPSMFPKVPGGGARQIAPAQWPKSTLSPTHLPTPAQLSLDTSVIKAASIMQKQTDMLARNQVVGATAMLAHKNASAYVFRPPTAVKR